MRAFQWKDARRRWKRRIWACVRASSRASTQASRRVAAIVSGSPRHCSEEEKRGDGIDGAEKATLDSAAAAAETAAKGGRTGRITQRCVHLGNFLN